ncbi:uncharacterized protein LOC110225075 [Arabidopsis lyrata subsp. lyrata]|uniref:uncharacterized protein LOC110225075 n=1 Tax=Arabidopsis lyrata subsp. lyrata TaxID=81972 RepID=UPI000A29CCAA|nr:uncharacterized protein LOC110225075 [Arabidopsis lyrata subsp. lyrata]|eukprot:XP_020869463.1 uncharacterized protein LOC110225075 [Arabidopsis lyrata subsp. lyrata]
MFALVLFRWEPINTRGSSTWYITVKLYVILLKRIMVLLGIFVMFGIYDGAYGELTKCYVFSTIYMIFFFLMLLFLFNCYFEIFLVSVMLYDITC